MRWIGVIGIVLASFSAPTFCLPAKAEETGRVYYPMPNDGAPNPPRPAPMHCLISPTTGLPVASYGIPHTPATVRNPQAETPWPLSLAEARRIALLNNKDVAYVQYTPIESDALVMEEDAVFDPVLELGGLWQSRDLQVANEIESFGSLSDEIHNKSFGPGPNLPDTIGIAKRLRTGGDVRASYGTDHEMLSPVGSFVLVNPAWYSRLNFRLEHSLLRGRGREIAEAGIHIAQANQRQSVHEFQATIQQQLRDIELAYWDIYYAHKDRTARHEAARQATETWNNEKLKLKLGEGTRPDVAQARVQKETFQIDATLADNDVYLAENRLRQLMGIPGWDGRRVVLLDMPVQSEFPIDWYKAAAEAVRRRPEVLAQQAAVRAAEIEFFRAKNGLLPEVNFVGNYSVVGLDDQWDKSLNRMTDNRWGSWTLGFVYRQPISRRPAYAQVRRTQAILCQQRALAVKREHDILHELQDAYQNLVATQKTLRQYRQRLEAAVEELRGREEFYRLGETTVDLFLRAQVAHVTAQREEALGRVRYNQAIARWEYAKGTMFDRSNVVLTEEIPAPEGKRLPERNSAETTIHLDFPGKKESVKESPLLPATNALPARSAQRR